MSQLSQLSQISDIVSDVDKFIEENGIVEDVNRLLDDSSNESGSTVSIYREEAMEEYKPKLVAIEFFGNPDYPQPPIDEKPFPPDQPENVCTEEYSGPFDFDVLIIPNEQKTPWEYSEKLKKIFIGINVKFPVVFRLRNLPKKKNLYVRATPVFSQSQHFQEIVARCVGHQHCEDQSNQGITEMICQHIIRCSHENTKYFGNKNTGTRLNVVIPLNRPQFESDLVKEFYHFVCKNSCSLGMNRRPIEVVFTLEDKDGKILGRRVVAVRVCSCPKRDKEKEEKDFDKINNPPKGKRRRIDGTNNLLNGVGSSEVDTRTYPINLNVVGKDNYLHILKTLRDRMASEILKCQFRNSADTPFKKIYNEVSKLIAEANFEGN